MNLKQATMLCFCGIALQASAAAVREAAPAKQAPRSVAAAKAAASDTLDEYLQWHRDSGFVVYASPLEAVAPDVNPANDSCAKARNISVN